MKIKHEYDDGRVQGHLTKGKVYEVIEDGNGYPCILNDRGRSTVIHLPRCAHLGARPWTIVEEEEE